MKKAFDLVTLLLVNAPKIKYVALLVVQIVDSLDGVKNWHVENKPDEPGTQKKK